MNTPEDTPLTKLVRNAAIAIRDKHDLPYAWIAEIEEIVAREVAKPLSAQQGGNQMSTPAKTAEEVVKEIFVNPYARTPDDTASIIQAFAQSFADRQNAKLKEELGMLRELVGVRSDTPACAADAQHWIKLMDERDRVPKLENKCARITAERDALAKQLAQAREALLAWNKWWVAPVVKVDAQQIFEQANKALAATSDGAKEDAK